MTHTSPTLALLPGGDRFEDFHDKIGVSLETFRSQLTGGWLFNYIKALDLAGVRTVLVFMSTRVDEPLNFMHFDTRAPVWVLPSPLLHQEARRAQRRFFSDSAALASLASYLATPLRAVARVLRHERCSAILCQEYEHPRFDASVLLGRRLGLPVFATYQGGGQPRGVIEARVRRFSVRHSAGLIIPSGDEIARVQQVYGITARRIGRIPNPIEVTGCQDKHTSRAALGIGSNTWVVAWHGRVQIQTKGLDILLDAWDRVCAARPEADLLLLLVGSGRDAERLGRRIESSRKVRWIAEYVLDRSKLYSYLSAADLYAITSRREGFAVAVLEAMACGLAVVASDAPGVVDVLPRGEADGGVIVPREDPGALARALLRLLDDPDVVRRLGAAARRSTEETYSLQSVGQHLRRFMFP